jgi:hypothetical protein
MKEIKRSVKMKRTKLTLKKCFDFAYNLIQRRERGEKLNIEELDFLKLMKERYCYMTYRGRTFHQYCIVRDIKEK